MQVLNLKTQLHKFNRIGEFIDEFEVGAGDLIVLNKKTYTDFLAGLSLNCDFTFTANYEIYGSSFEMLEKILKDIKGKIYRRIIGVGDGSILDIAKLLALKNVNNPRELIESKELLNKDKELILIPTTSDTGNEVKFYTEVSVKDKSESIITKNESIIARLDGLYADHSIAITDLLSEIPYELFAISSLDALVHASEAFVSPKADGYNELFSEKAIEMILKGYADIFFMGKDARHENMEEFITAGSFAGIATESTGVGAVHALSYPLSCKYNVPHGEANYQCFLEVFKLYSCISPKGRIKRFAELVAEILKLDVCFDDYESGYYVVFDRLEQILSALWKRRSLREFGMLEKEIQIFAKDVMKDAQKLLSNSYAAFGEIFIEDIYKNIY